MNMQARKNQVGSHGNLQQQSIQVQLATSVNNLQPSQQGTITGFQNPTNEQKQMQNPQNNILKSDFFADLAEGFGKMFFNLRDPTFRQAKIPIKRQSSMNILAPVFNLIFIAGLLIGVIGYKRFLGIGVTITIIIITYAAYLFVSYLCIDIRQYLQNMKKYDEFAITYDQMVKGKGYFTFWIECYHYVTRHYKGRSSRQKVVTHMATQTFHVAQTVDQSGDLQNIYDVKDFIFLHYLKRFYFSDDRGQQIFKSAYNAFVSRNTRDVHQNHHHTFQIDGYQQFAAFTATGQIKSLVFFHIFTFLGLASPYACIFQRSVARYDVGMLKRLTV